MVDAQTLLFPHGKHDGTPLFPLESFCIGMWKVRKHQRLFVLVLRQQRKFVFIVVFDSAAKERGRFERAISKRVHQVLDIRGPFSLDQLDEAEEHGGCVIAFEVDWSSIVGMDYKNCLLQEGRLVLECKSVPKRLFARVDDVREFYEWAPLPLKLLALPAPPPKRVASPRPDVKLSTEPAKRTHMPNPAHPTVAVPAATSTATPSPPPTLRRRAASTSPAPGGPTRIASADPLSNQSSVSAPTSHPIATISPRSNPPEPTREDPAPSDGFVFTKPPPSRPSDPTTTTHLNPLKHPLWPKPAVPPPPRSASSASSNFSSYDSSSTLSCAPSSTHSAPTELLQSYSPNSPLTPVSPFTQDPPLRSHSPAPPPRPAQQPPLLMRLRASSGSLDDPHHHQDAEPPRARPISHVRSSSMQQLRSSFDVPSAARWTVPSATYTHCTLVVNFSDPRLPRQLGHCIRDDLRLLKLYESGLPAWAVLLPSLGLFYRPWMRSATWFLFLAVTLFSMACGFYDLYKNVPYLRHLAAVIGQQLHATAVLRWLEAHTQLRLSILLTYLFGKSPMFAAFLRAASATARVAANLLRPILGAIANVLHPLVAALRHFTLHLARTALATLRALAAAATALATPPARAVRALAALAARAAAPLLDALLGPLTAVAAALHAALDTLFLPVHYLGTLFAFLRGLFTLTSKLAGPSAADLASSASRGGLPSWLSFIPTDALLLLRTTVMKVVRGAQAVVRFVVALGTTVNQHRISIMLQLDARWLRVKRRVLGPLVRVPGARKAARWLLQDGAAGGAAAAAGLALDGGKEEALAAAGEDEEPEEGDDDMGGVGLAAVHDEDDELHGALLGYGVPVEAGGVYPGGMPVVPGDVVYGTLGVGGRWQGAPLFAEALRA